MFNFKTLIALFFAIMFIDAEAKRGGRGNRGRSSGGFGGNKRAMKKWARNRINEKMAGDWEEQKWGDHVENMWRDARREVMGMMEDVGREIERGMERENMDMRAMEMMMGEVSEEEIQKSIDDFAEEAQEHMEKVQDAIVPFMGKVHDGFRQIMKGMKQT